MPRATHEPITPELREVRFVRAVPPTPISFRQPLRGGRYRAISGRLLGETQFDGVLHHYRVATGDGVLFLVPPEWVQLMGGKVIAATCRNSPPMCAEVLA